MNREQRAILLIVLYLLISMNVFSQQNEPQKYALVIGNGNYVSFGSLPNALNDAEDMAATLQELGFTVETIRNGNRVQMAEGIMRLKNRLSVSKNSYGFFYYAGHGVQNNGNNYLIPSDVYIPSANYLGDTSISVQAMLAELNDAENELNIIVLDACRDFPAAWSRSMNRGLTVVSNQPADSIIVYATSAGSIAQDGTGRNGLFTSHLLTQLRTPGLSVTEIFNRTGSAVSQASNRQQIPAIYSQYFETAYLGASPMPAAITELSPAAEQRPQTLSAQTPAGSNIEMVQISAGTLAWPYATMTLSAFKMGKYEITQRQYQDIMGYNPSHFRSNPEVGENQDNRPVEYVTWYDAVEFCNKLSEREGLTPVYTITGRTPVLGYPIISATVTADWNASGYRLPTEAQWEYVCRAGTTTNWHFGNTESQLVNYALYNANSGSKTHEVGKKLPNAWGLYDMHGNVREWCWDWYGTLPTANQTNYTGAASGSSRLARGGSWSNSAENTQLGNRSSYSPDYRNSNIGFRVVRP